MLNFQSVFMCSIFPLLFGGGLWALWRLRYPRRPAFVAVIVVAFSSFIIALIVMDSASVGWYERWRHAMSLSALPISLEYRPSSGLFARTSEGERQITGAMPICLLDGVIARDSESAVAVTMIENVQLAPSLPPPPKFQVTLRISYANEMGDHGVVSYAAYPNGEIWCVENIVRPGEFRAFGDYAAMGWIASFEAIRAFIGCFVVGAVIASLALETHIRLWNRKRNPEYSTANRMIE